MKHYLLAAIVFFLSLGVSHAQIPPLSSGDTVIAEASSNAKEMTSSNPKIAMVWNDVKKVEFTVEKDGGLLTFRNDVGNVVLNLDSFVYYMYSNKTTTPPHTVKTTFDGSISRGKAWESKHITTGTPVSWCSATADMMISSDSEIGEKEQVTITIDGVTDTLDVFPIYERGWWTRCVSGKIFRKTLYSPDLRAPVSMELAMFPPSGGQVHTSFLVAIKEVKRKK